MRRGGAGALDLSLDDSGEQTDFDNRGFWRGNRGASFGRRLAERDKDSVSLAAVTTAAGKEGGIVRDY